MAFTSRDVMFMLRAQDHASRQVLGLARTFGRLAKESKVADDNLGRRLGASQERLNEGMKALDTSAKKVSETLTKKVAKSHDTASRAVSQSKDKYNQQIKALENSNRAMDTATAKQKLMVAQGRAWRQETLARYQLEEKQRAYAKQRNRNEIAELRQMRDAEVSRIEQTQKARETAYKREAQAAKGHLEQRKKALADTEAAEQAAARAAHERHRQRIAQAQQSINQHLMVGGAMIAAGAAMTAFGIRGVRALTDIAKEAVEFNRVIALALTQTDGLNTSVEELTAVALRVGREVPAAMENIPATLYDIFSSVKTDVAGAEILLRGFAQEAVAGNADIQDSARSTMAIMNGMGLVVEDNTQLQENLTRVQNFQFQTVRKGVITYEQLAKTIGRLIPSLRRMGQEVEEGGAMLSFLTRNGLSAQMAATAAARSLELIGDPRVVQRLEDMGIVVRDKVNGEFIAFSDIVMQLGERMAALPAPERAQKMLELFGGAGYRIQARRFFDTVFADLDNYRQHVRWATQDNEAFAEALAIMMETPASKAQALSNAITALRTELGTHLFAAFEQVIDVVKRGVEGFAALDDGTKQNIVRFIGIATAALAVAGPLIALTGIIITMAAMIRSVWAVSTGWSLFMAGSIPVAILAVVGALIMLLLHGRQVMEWVRNVTSNFEGVEGKLKLVTVAFVLLTAATWGFVTAGVTIPGLTASIAASFTGLITKIKATATAMQAFAVAHPILLAMTIIATALVAVWYALGSEARRLNEAVNAHTDALSGQIGAITESMDGFQRRHEIINDTIKATAEQSLKEAELDDALKKSNITRAAYLESIAQEGRNRGEVLESMDHQIDAMRSQEAWYEKLLSGAKLWHSANVNERTAQERLREEYKLQVEASKAAREQMLEEMRARGGVNKMIAQYIELEDASDQRSATLRNNLQGQIGDLLITAEAWAGMDEETKNWLRNSDEFGEAAEKVDEVTTAISTLASAVAGASDPMSLYNDKLGEMNEAGRKMAEKTAENTKKASDSWEDYYTDVEASAQAFFEAQEQQLEDQRAWFANLQKIREMGHEEYSDYLMSLGPEQAALVADISRQSEAEIAKSADIQQKLQRENIEQQIAIWQRVGGGELVDEVGQISLEAVGAMAEQLNLSPGIIERALLAGNTVATAQLNKIEELFGTKARTAAEKMVKEFGWGQTELAGIMKAMAEIAGEGGELTVEALSDALGMGTGEIYKILQSYGGQLIGGLNPILQQLGKKLIGGRAAAAAGQKVSFGMNEGGVVPGRGPDRDSVPTVLTPGEFVLRRQAVDNLDLHALHELNRTGNAYSLVQKVQHYNKGGFVTTGDIPKPPTNYGVYKRPLIRPGQGTAEVAYDAAFEFVKKYGAPPLGSGIGWKKQWAAVSNRFPGVNLHSAFRPGAITATGNPSYHGQGRAIDISPRMDIFNWLAENYRNSREIIYSPAGSRQIHNGRNHVYSGITKAMHYDHIHWAMKNGGIINEPIIGQGLSTGSMYSFGEGGHPEQVTPVGASASIEDKLDQLIELLAEREPVQISVSTKDDPDDFARRSATALKARM